MSPLTEPTRIVLRNGWQPMDPDAAAYITAVETADGQALEEKVKIAIDNFVLGCKADGIWNAIKASCILAGARTLDGALVPLAGSAPTNFNFVAGDYNRKTGLVGNGSTKYLNSNRASSLDDDNSAHLAVYHTTRGAQYVMGANSATAANQLEANGKIFFRSRYVDTESGVDTSFYGASKSGSVLTGRRYGRNLTSSTASVSGNTTVNYTVFARNISNSPTGFSATRLAFYSIGEALDLALLDARVTDLINKFAEVIP